MPSGEAKAEDALNWLGIPFFLSPNYCHHFSKVGADHLRHFLLHPGARNVPHQIGQQMPRHHSFMLPLQFKIDATLMEKRVDRVWERLDEDLKEEYGEPFKRECTSMASLLCLQNNPYKFIQL
jgi:hypothetical protein